LKFVAPPPKKTPILVWSTNRRKMGAYTWFSTPMSRIIKSTHHFACPDAPSSLMTSFPSGGPHCRWFSMQSRVLIQLVDSMLVCLSLLQDLRLKMHLDPNQIHLSLCMYRPILGETNCHHVQGMAVGRKFRRTTRGICWCLWSVRTCRTRSIFFIINTNHPYSSDWWFYRSEMRRTAARLWCK